MNTLIDTIDVIDHGASVIVVLQVGDVQHARASCVLRSETGVDHSINPMQPQNRYDLGSASTLVNQKVLVCVVHLADPGGGNGHPYFAICSFYQGGVHAGSSTPFSGTYQNGQALAEVTFICRFS